MLHPPSIKCGWKRRTSSAVAVSGERPRNTASRPQQSPHAAPRQHTVRRAAGVGGSLGLGRPCARSVPFAPRSRWCRRPRSGDPAPLGVLSPAFLLDGVFYDVPHLADCQDVSLLPFGIVANPLRARPHAAHPQSLIKHSLLLSVYCQIHLDCCPMATVSSHIIGYRTATVHRLPRRGTERPGAQILQLRSPALDRRRCGERTGSPLSVWFASQNCRGLAPAAPLHFSFTRPIFLHSAYWVPSGRRPDSPVCGGRRKGRRCQAWRARGRWACLWGTGVVRIGRRG